MAMKHDYRMGVLGAVGRGQVIDMAWGHHDELNIL